MGLLSPLPFVPFALQPEPKGAVFWVVEMISGPGGNFSSRLYLWREDALTG